MSKHVRKRKMQVHTGIYNGHESNKEQSGMVRQLSVEPVSPTFSAIHKASSFFSIKWKRNAMSTMTTHNRHPLNPSSRLTATSNAAQPALSSHQESVVQAQRACAAAEAQNTASATPSLSITTPVLIHVNLNNQPRSNAGSLPITPTTLSIPPQLLVNDEDM